MNITNRDWNRREMARIDRLIEERGTTLQGYCRHYAKPENRQFINPYYTARDVYQGDQAWRKRVEARKS